MYSLIQFPIADVRRFVSPRRQLLNRPCWATPDIGQDFLKSVGILEYRRLGGHSGLLNEHFYCNARNLVKLSQSSIFGTSTGSRCLGRRLFFDGSAVVRFEYAFESYCDEEKIDVDEFVREVMAQPVRLKDRDFELQGIGKALSEAYAKASSPTSDAVVESGEVRCFSPLIVLVQSVEDAVVKPRGFSSLNASAITGQDERNLGVFYRNIRLASTYCEVICIRSSYKYLLENHPERRIRPLRIMVSRLHAERKVLAYVLSRIADGYLQLLDSSDRDAYDRLQEYLGEATGRLTGRSDKIFPSEPLSGTCDFGLAPPGQVESLLTQAARIRGNYLANLKKYLGQTNPLVINLNAVVVEGDNFAPLEQTIGDTASGIGGAAPISQAVQEIRIERNNTGGINQTINGS